MSVHPFSILPVGTDVPMPDGTTAKLVTEAVVNVAPGQVIAQEQWAVGRNGQIISNLPQRPGDDVRDLAYYGGYLICESVGNPRTARLLAAALDLFNELDAALEYFDETLAPCDDDCECFRHSTRALLARIKGEPEVSA